MPELEYRRLDENTNQYIYMCLDCAASGITKEFDSLPGWKTHMQKFHGGYTESDVDTTVSTSQTGAADGKGQPLRGTPAALKPKKLSKKAQELNDKLNRCISLTIDHLMDGIKPEQMQELYDLRSELMQAIVGIEFDFDEGRLVAISSKWVMVFCLGMLYALPKLPSLKVMLQKAREAQQKKQVDKEVK